MIPGTRWLGGCAALATCAISLSARAAPSVNPNVAEIMRLLPADAQVAIIIPNLKYASDELTRLLEGMDRVNLLLGSRPIDQVKSAIGFSVGVRDSGSGAIVFGNQHSTPAVIVPVSDPETFLTGNLKKVGDNAYMLPDGERTLHAKSLGGHVALSFDQPLVQSVGTAAADESGMPQALHAALGDRSVALLNSSEAIIITRQNGYSILRQALLRVSGQVDDPMMRTATLAMLASVETGMLAIDFDPLGLVIRSLARLKPDTHVGQVAKDIEPSRTTGLVVPNKPFYFAVSVDVEAVGGPQTLSALLAMAGLPPLPGAIANAQSIDFAAYPSPAGLAGGLLNDAIAILHAPDPSALKATLKSDIVDAPQLKGPIQGQTRWNEVDDPAKADTYEIKILDLPPDLAQWRMAESLVFGRAGWRGFVQDLPEHKAVVVTFSQRPAVLQAAVDAAATPDAGLSSNGAIRTMRNWLPARRDIELYFGIAQLGGLAAQIAESFGQGDAALPQFDENLPPIGIGVDIRSGGMETATVIPAKVLAVMADLGVRSSQQIPPDPANDSGNEER